MHPYRLFWQAGFPCLDLSAQHGSTMKPMSIIRTLASFPPSPPDPVGRWLSAGKSVLSLLFSFFLAWLIGANVDGEQRI